MEALVHNTLDDFLAVAGDFLDADPVNHSVHLTTVDSALRGIRPPAALLSLHSNGTLVGAATRMQDRPLHVAAMPVAAAPVVAEVLRGQPIDAVTGPVDRVEAFRVLWRDGGRETYRLRLYQLGELVIPAVDGESRLATAEDDSLITEWWVRFVAELDGLERDEAEKVMRGSRTMPAGHVLWEVDGVVVAWAGTTMPVAGVSRVGPVYTPPEHRRHGYGAAVTAAVSRWAYGAGAEHVVLTADLANPTANSVYQGIGFRPVSDWSEYRW
ncbi:GNAT family N-acetyltransferase [Lentzea flava]|uniref:Acetyltransferase n=1 Tax=Lentzea flava TaxID=103732 RepID=A0ABQ2UPQ1_9PSEU|nr:GNAT family N-acetyltransferase [Lentzea flava]MCP2201068.1 FR47-like protein [Lentzea flava]GGU47847.1 putative acetyltransferase [Lentzea flava]